MKKIILALLITLFMFSGCFNESQDHRLSKLDQVISDIEIYGNSRKSDAIRDGIYVNVGSNLEFYGLDFLTNMTFDDKVELLDNLDEAPKNSYVIISELGKLFSDYISYEDLLATGLPAADLLSMYTGIVDMESGDFVYPDGNPVPDYISNVDIFFKSTVDIVNLRMYDIEVTTTGEEVTNVIIDGNITEPDEIMISDNYGELTDVKLDEVLTSITLIAYDSESNELQRLTVPLPANINIVTISSTEEAVNALIEYASIQESAYVDLLNMFSNDNIEDLFDDDITLEEDDYEKINELQEELVEEYEKFEVAVTFLEGQSGGSFDRRFLKSIFKFSWWAKGNGTRRREDIVKIFENLPSSQKEECYGLAKERWGSKVGDSLSDFESKLNSGELDNSAPQIHKQFLDYNFDYNDKADDLKKGFMDVAHEEGTEGLKKGVDVVSDAWKALSPDLTKGFDKGAKLVDFINKLDLDQYRSTNEIRIKNWMKNKFPGISDSDIEAKAEEMAKSIADYVRMAKKKNDQITDEEATDSGLGKIKSNTDEDVIARIAKTSDGDKLIIATGEKIDSLIIPEGIYDVLNITSFGVYISSAIEVLGGLISGNGDAEAPTPPENRVTSWGDPHLVTFDGYCYDFQGVGEFVFFTNTEDSEFMEIQTRQQPYYSSRYVSINIGAAIMVNEDIVEIYADPEKYGSQLLVNSQLANLENNKMLYLSNGGEVYYSGSTYKIVWPDSDGTQVHITVNNNYYININGYFSDDFFGKLSGTIGTFDGDVQNEFTTKEGVKLSSPPAWPELYTVFGESWRISQDESLFTYIEGESTATYQDYNFPEGIKTVDDLSQEEYDAARQLAEESGITDPTLLENAIFDYVMTGDQSFIDSVSDEDTNGLFEDLPPDINVKISQNNMQVTISGSVYRAKEMEVDWGDGTKETYTEDLENLSITHTYAEKKTFTIKLTAENENSDTIENTYVVDFEVAGIGSVSGVVRDATTGGVIEGATVELTSDSNTYTSTSNSNGQYSFSDIPSGSYTINIQKDNYITYEDTITVSADQETTIDSVISAVVSSEEWRIVLTWGSSPEDLDSHLWNPTNEHLYWEDEYISDANLDIDDTDSYGPETITITNQGAGEYIYSVYDYDETGNLTSSNAKVDVYKGTTLVRTFRVPTSGTGHWWNVFRLNGNDITVVNEIATSHP